MSQAEAIVLLTVYTVLATIVIFVPLRADFDPGGMPALLLGSVLGTPLGVWVLAALPASALTRLIGLVLLAVVALEWLGVYPARLPGRRWALGAGVAAGGQGAGGGKPRPPAGLFPAAPGGGPRAPKGHSPGVFFRKQGGVRVGYCVAGLPPSPG